MQLPLEDSRNDDNQKAAVANLLND